MSDRTQIILALIVGLPLIITAISNLVIAILSRRQVGAVVEKLDTVHGQIDGMKDQLVATTRAEGQAAGEAIGREKAIEEKAARTAEAERVEDRALEKK
jgi:uncharacterized protein YoxC